MEYEPQFNLPWYEDEEGCYLRIRTQEGVFDIRQDDTDIYTHIECPEADHIFHELYTNENEVAMGFRLFRGKMDDVMGVGAFDCLIEDMRRRNFFEIVAQKPTEEDLRAFQEEYGRLPESINQIDLIVQLAIKNFDKEWEYYSGEEKWGGQS